MSSESSEALNSGSNERVDSSSPLIGTVVAVQANYYWIHLDSPSALSTPTASVTSLLCTRPSRLKKIGQQVMVGDRVQVEKPDWVSRRGAIAQVFARHSELDRPPIANANQVLLIFALAEPTPDPFQMSRFLVKAESTGMRVCLGLNKSDLVKADEQRHWSGRLEQWGYTPLLLSTKTGEGLIALQQELAQAVTVISGPSGVGKSSLINHLIPEAMLRVGTVSGKLGRGRHTTRHVELFELPTQGFLADTPGFNQPDLDCIPEDLATYFPEARQRLRDDACQFHNCLHREEPNCVVRGDWERYEHYLLFLEDVIAHQTVLSRSGTPEATVKVKSGQEGQIQYEPKLATKKYRRPSRRTEKQSLQNFYKIQEPDSEEED